MTHESLASNSKLLWDQKACLKPDEAISYLFDTCNLVPWLQGSYMWLS